MLTQLLFPGLRGVHIGRVWWADTTLHVEAATTGRTARCLWGAKTVIIAEHGEGAMPAPSVC
jgi:hypothetical protein